MTSLPAPEEQSRQQFEAFVRSMDSLDSGYLLDRCRDKYFYSRTQSAWEAWSAAHRLYAPALPEPEAASKTCHCEVCDPVRLEVDEEGHFHSPNMRMIVCSICGNKRCPHATDHRNACTNSNAIGQKGSSWEHVTPAKETP